MNEWMNEYIKTVHSSWNLCRMLTGYVFISGYNKLLLHHYMNISGPGSSVGIVTSYTGWTVWGSNPGKGEIFRTCPDWPWGQPSLLYNGYLVFPGGKERPGCDADPSPPSSAIGHERVELYLYSPYGLYGLYTASVPVQGWPLPFFIWISK
jgi:hypothetical protein